MWRGLRNLMALLAIVAMMAALGATVRRFVGDDNQGTPSAAGPDSPSAGRVRLPSTGPEVLLPHDARSGFVHPGILVSARQLEFVRERINAGEQPWTDAFMSMRRSTYASLSWQPKPRAVVECGGFSVPDLGCRDEWSDAIAAYTHALLWYLTGTAAHADKAVEILDAWSGVVQQHTNSNAPVQAGWSAASFVRAAELIRHTYEMWAPDRVARAATMFRTVYLPLVGDGAAPGSGGNWELIILASAAGIAVFLDDRELFDRAVAKWRTRVPAFIYLTSDGPYPKGPPGGASTRPAIVGFWHGLSTFVDGVSQETCRDFGHTGWGFAALAQVAETARIQGIDLYAEVGPRVVAGLEFHAGYEMGASVPGWLCGGTITPGFQPAQEVAYNHFAVRLGVSLPQTTAPTRSGQPGR